MFMVIALFWMFLRFRRFLRFYPFINEFCCRKVARYVYGGTAHIKQAVDSYYKGDAFRRDSDAVEDRSKDDEADAGCCGGADGGSYGGGDQQYCFCHCKVYAENLT